MGEINSVVCSLGSNLGDRSLFLEEAINQIRVKIGTISKVSAIYETPPLSFDSANNFLNLCIIVETSLDPTEFLRVSQEIEKDLGRKKKTSGTYESRTIDIDIIFFGDKVLHLDELSIPHPRFRDRKFVLLPLIDLGANRIDPVTNLTIQQLLANSIDKSIIKEYEKDISSDD